VTLSKLVNYLKALDYYLTILMKIPKIDFKELFVRHTVWFMLAAILIFFFFVTNTKIFAPTTIKYIFLDAAALAVMTFGFAFPLMSGKIDLSSGSIAGFTAMFGAFLVSDLPYASGLMVDPILAIIISLGLGCGIGLLNGFLIIKGRMTDFMTTLAMLIALRGLTIYITGGFPVYNLPDTFMILGRPEIFGIPIQMFIIAIFAVIFWTILKHTKFGLHVLLTGDSELTARAMGINTNRIRIICYILSGFTAAFAGLMLAGRIGNVTAHHAEGIIFKCFAAAIIGGVSMRGGVGSIFGIVGGALLLPTIASGLLLIGVSSKLIEFSTGVIILFAIALDVFKRRL
jgi:ribose/xylose/arabinose/galactoside ABC-type transport system permease subunit